MKLYHCRINMLLVRADGPFVRAELESISAMMQAVTDAVGKASNGAIRTYVEVEPRLRPLPQAEESETGASMKVRQKVDAASVDRPRSRRKEGMNDDGIRAHPLRGERRRFGRLLRAAVATPVRSVPPTTAPGIRPGARHQLFAPGSPGVLR